MNSQDATTVQPRSHPSTFVPNEQTNSKDALISSFKDVDTYRKMCTIFLQILKGANTEPNLLTELQRKLFDLKNIEREITLKGGIGNIQTSTERVPAAEFSSLCSVSALRQLISTVEGTLLSTKEFQEKREYIQVFMRSLLQSIPQTTIDIETLSHSKVDRFRSQFPRKRRSFQPETSNEISLQKLRNLIGQFRKPRETDYLLTSRLLKTCFGHGAMEEDLCFSQVFNVIYDKSGRLVVSADEEGLIKIWSAETGLLLWSLKGHASSMQKLLMTASNRYLVSCGNDSIRIWCMRTMKCVVVLYCETSILSVTSYTDSATQEEVVCFADAIHLYQISESHFANLGGKCLSLSHLVMTHPIPKNRRENNLVCELDISSQGYAVVGMESGEIVVFDRTLLQQIKPSNIAFAHSWEHTNKCVEIKWNKQGNMFISCSLDGACRIWEFSVACFGEGIIKSIEQLRMPKNEKRRNRRKQVMCNTVNWTCNYNYIIVAFSECNRQAEENHGQGDIIIFDANKLSVLHEVRSKLSYPLQAVNVLEPHPLHENIALYCECSGRIVLFDILQCVILSVFNSRGFHLSHPNFFIQPVEGKWSPNGDTFVISSEYGNISIYGYGAKDMYRICPTEQFYASDNEMFIYDNNRVPITIDGQIDINNIDRGPVCNVNKVPYQFRYHNDIEDLFTKGFFNVNPTPPVELKENCYQVSSAYVASLQQQMNENLSQQEVFKTATLSISQIELLDQQKMINSRLSEALNMKVQQYNSLSQNKLIQNEEKVEMIEELVVKKANRFKKLRRDAVSSEDEQEYRSDQMVSEQQPSYSSEEVIKKRKRRRDYQQQNQQREEPRHTRRSPQEQIQEMQEEYNNEIERKNQRRKMLHRLEDDEDVYGQTVQSDSKKGSNSDSTDLCARCEIDHIYKVCPDCRHGYCENCKAYRGRGNDFHCFECLVKKNTCQQERNVIKQPYERDRRTKDTYVPQLGDEVYFFFQGYEELVMKYYDCFNPKISQMVDKFKLIDFDDNKFLRRNPECVIRRINYLFPLKSRDRVDRLHEQRSRHNLLAVLQLQAVEQSHKFYVYYIVGGIDYLVRKELLKYTDEHRLIKELQVNDIVKVDGVDLQIMNKGPLEDIFEQSSWKYLQVRDSNERLRRNQKNDQRINVWRIDSIPNLPFESIKEDFAKKILASIQQLRQAKPDIFEYFYYDVDLKAYRDYNTFVQVSVSVEKIEKRLRNKYYRCDKSLTFDINLLEQNSEVFNGSDHFVTAQAMELRDELLKIVESGGNVMFHVNEEQKNKQPKRSRLREAQRKQQEDSESYKEDQNIQMKEEEEQSFSNYASTGQRRMTRSSRQPAQTKQQRGHQRHESRRLTRRTYQD